MTSNVDAILHDIRSAVMDGRYEHLTTLLPDLRQAEADLIADDLTVLRPLKAEAERTVTCLQAALAGVRAARRRVTEVAEAAKGLTTYDREGVRATVPAVAPTSRRV